MTTWRSRGLAGPFFGARAYFQVGSLRKQHGCAIAEVAEAAGRFPDVDVRPEDVTIRTASREYGALSHRDVELARRISAEARSRGLSRTHPRSRRASGGGGCGQRRRSILAAALGYGGLRTKEASWIPHDSNPHVCVPKPPPSPSPRARPDPHRRQRAGRSGRSKFARPRSKLADAFRMRHTLAGGRSRRPRTTVSTSASRSQTSRTTRRTEPR